MRSPRFRRGGASQLKQGGIVRVGLAQEDKTSFTFFELHGLTRCTQNIRIETIRLIDRPPGLKQRCDPAIEQVVRERIVIIDRAPGWSQSLTSTTQSNRHTPASPHRRSCP